MVVRRSPEDDAVSSVVGTALMLGVTVTVFAGFSLFVLGELEDEPRPPRSDLAVLQSGTQTLLMHRGGETVALSGRVLVNVGGIERELDLTDLADQAADGERWRIGESLCLSGPSPPCLLDRETVLGVLVVQDNTVLLQQGERGVPAAEFCTGDTTAPSVDSWVQAPADVTTVTAGPVTVTAVVADGCAGVDTGVAPVLRHRVNDGSDPAYGAVPMTLSGGAWTADVPDPGWASQDGKTLEYYVQGLTDLRGNSGDSAVQSDAIGAPGVPDPGFPFEDVDGDGAYIPGTDVPLDPALVADGVHDAGANGLVIPTSVGPISAPQIGFTADGDVFIGVALTAQSDPLSIQAGGNLIFDGSGLVTLQNNDAVTLAAGGAIEAAGLTVSTRGDLTATGGGDLDFTGSGLETLTNGDPITLQSTSGSVVLAGATLDSRGEILVTAANSILATGSVLTTLVNGDDTVLTAGGDIDLTDATVPARGHIEATAGGSLLLSGASLETLNNDKDINLDAGATLSGDAGTSLVSRGHVTLQAAEVALPDVAFQLLVSGKDLTVTATGGVDLSGATVEARGHVEASGATVDLSGATVDILQTSKRLRATATASLAVVGLQASVQGPTTLTGGTVDASGASVTSMESGDDIILAANAGSLTATGLVVDGKGGFSATASTTLDLSSSTLTLSGSTEDITATAGTFLTATGSSWNLLGKATLTAGTSVTLASASVTSTGSSKDIIVTAGNGDLDVQGATLRTTRNIKLNVNTSGFLALGSSGTVFDDANDKADVTPNGRHNNTPPGVWE